MIKSIHIKNFRSIEEETIKISPITIFYGPNSTGKSSVLYSFIILKNIMLNPSLQPDTFFDLKFVNLGGFSKVVFEHRENKEISFSVNTVKNGYDILYHVSLCKEKGKFKLSSNIDNRIVKFIVNVTFPYPLNIFDKQIVEYDGDPFEINWNGITAQATPQKEQTPKLLDKSKELIEIINSPIEELRKIEIIPVKRGFSKQIYNPVGITDFLFSEEEVATNLANDILLQGKLGTYLERILYRDFRAHSPPGIALFTLNTIEKPSGLTVDVVNDGFGVNQVIWLLSKCLRTDIDFICIEEPELHLHPTAIRRLAKELIRIVRNERKTLLISTHSESFITAFLSFISKGELDPEDISIYLSRKEEGITKFEHQKVNEKGQVSGGLPSFIEGELEDLKEFLKIVD